MKRLITAPLVLGLVLTMGACGKNANKTPLAAHRGALTTTQSFNLAQEVNRLTGVTFDASQKDNADLSKQWLGVSAVVKVSDNGQIQTLTTNAKKANKGVASSQLNTDKYIFINARSFDVIATVVMEGIGTIKLSGTIVGQKTPVVLTKGSSDCDTAFQDYEFSAACEPRGNAAVGCPGLMIIAKKSLNPTTTAASQTATAAANATSSAVGSSTAPTNSSQAVTSAQAVALLIQAQAPDSVDSGETYQVTYAPTTSNIAAIGQPKLSAEKALATTDGQVVNCPLPKITPETLPTLQTDSESENSASDPGSSAASPAAPVVPAASGPAAPAAAAPAAALDQVAAANAAEASAAAGVALPAAKVTK
jgi:hypothetical protein